MSRSTGVMQIRQHVRYTTSSDGARLAWAEAGSGQPIVKAANWLTHLEYEWVSPLWKHWLRFLGGLGRFVRYDERGCGLSDWNRVPLTLDQWVEDLEAVIDAARPTGPLTLLGISQGAATCIRYAVRRPERVARLVLYGGYAHGAAYRGTAADQVAYRAMVDLARAAWDRDNSTFRQVFTSRFIPEATPEQLAWFNDLCRKTSTGEVVAELLHARATVDVSDLLGQVRVPTLVLHARRDEVIPVSEGRVLAAGIAGAEFVELDSRNHVLLEHEPAWSRFMDAVAAFVGGSRQAGSPFEALSAREREVLAAIAAGLRNAEIAERLNISEKTVRNHASVVFEKLGVSSRAQAIVFARDHDFQG
jgi:pimeloyl-ACP methyl ester carboxylesterase/DNA-binding CsgD family transcriptional regulator